MQRPEHTRERRRIAALLIFLWLAGTPVATPGDQEMDSWPTRLALLARGAFGVLPEEVSDYRHAAAEHDRAPGDVRAARRHVDALAALAERTREPEELARLLEAQRSLRTLVAPQAESELALARTLIGLHRFAEALEHARRAGRLAPASAAVAAVLGDAHLALGHVLEAELFYERLVAISPGIGAWSRLAEVRLARGREAEALDAWAKATGAEAPGKAAERARLETLIGDHWLERGDLGRAADHYAKALALEPHEERARFGHARLAIRRGALGDAELALLELVERFPRPSYWLALATLLDAMGREPEALPYRHRARADFLADIASGHLGHLRDMAELAIAQGNAEDAIQWARRDLAEVRQDAGAYETLAWAIHNAGDSTAALAPLARSLEPGARPPERLRRAAIIRRSALRPPAEDRRPSPPG